ncbi:MAG TPA: hypothetical protein VG253_16665 [Streptosporangiaceae bacterium]|nr:hypothetical protein [Streptosporangiaceae bacterium]
MTAETPGVDAIANLVTVPVTDGLRTLEVRWIFPGQLEAAVAGWFGRFPAGTESREDIYLLDPQLGGLSVKVRGGEALEVKVLRDSPGILDVAGRARGRMQSWQKWSFPLRLPGQERGNPAGWRRVAKRRLISRFPLSTGRVAPHGPGPGQAECRVELAEVRSCGYDWWSLGFEAAGPPELLRSELEASAALVFAEVLPGGQEIGLDESGSYADWLVRWPDADSPADI